ncbi:hypothetical protein [Streptomyces sp. T12]|uniref:hypothetical protein n=1 Tax=Streptomyces sp. T12 TaxID=477697 RepID=UPI0035A36DC8
MPKQRCAPLPERQGYDVEVIAGHIRDGIAEVLAETDISPERRGRPLRLPLRRPGLPGRVRGRRGAPGPLA